MEETSRETAAEIAATETERAAWREETERRVSEARREERRRARELSREELLERDAAERSEALDRREKEIALRETRAEAMRLLREKKLPEALIGAIGLGEGREAMEKSLSEAETAFRSAVQAGVEERLRGSVPRAGRSESGEELSDEMYYAGVWGAR